LGLFNELILDGPLPPDLEELRGLNLQFKWGDRDLRQYRLGDRIAWPEVNPRQRDYMLRQFDAAFPPGNEAQEKAMLEIRGIVEKYPARRAGRPDVANGVVKVGGIGDGPNADAWEAWQRGAQVEAAPEGGFRFFEITFDNDVVVGVREISEDEADVLDRQTEFL
jgi:hypothetical protein